jgi:hypothetical protein
MHHSRESIETVESSDNPTPSAPLERETLPPSYFEAVNFEEENKRKLEH